MKRLFLILALTCTLFAQAQEEFYTFDMSTFLTDMEKPWSIGNAWNELYFEVEVFGGMNFNGHTLEIMRTKITVYGDTINSGEIIKRFPDSELIVEESLSLPEYTPPNINLYPNPADTQVTIDGDYIERLVIYDINGKPVQRIKVNGNKFELDVSRYSSGLYVVQLWLINNRGTFKKLIIE